MLNFVFTAAGSKFTIYMMRGIRKYSLSIAALLLLAAITAPTPSTAAKPVTISGSEDKCITAYESNDYALAIEACTAAINESPGKSSLYLKRGDAHLMQRDIDKSRLDYSKAVELDSSSIEGYHKRALIYFATKQYDKAVEDYTLALKARPDVYISYYFRGLARIESGKHAEAAEDITSYLNAAEKETPSETGPAAPERLAEAHFYRGISFFYLEKLKEAVLDFDACIELFPKKNECYYNRGMTKSLLNDNKNAVADFTKAIELNPEHERSYVYRGNTLLSLDRYEEALKDFSKALELDPLDGYAYSGRATALGFLGDSKNALIDSAKAVELAPNDTVTLLNHAELLIITGNYEEALKTAQKAFDLAEDDGFKLIASYLGAIGAKLSGALTAEYDTRFAEYAKKGGKPGWSFTVFDKWFDKAKLKKDARSYIKEKTLSMKALSK